VTSHNPQKTHRLLNQLLTVAGLITDVSAGGQSGNEAEQLTGKYKIGVVDNKPAYCYTEQVGRATIVALSPEVLQACLSAAKTRQSALNAGPLKESLERLPAETSKLVVVNVAGAMRSADSYLSWQYDNPKNPGHRLIGQLAQALDKTTVYLRTGEQLNSFNVHAGVEQIPPLGSVFPIAMQLSQTDLQAKARATEPEPSDGAVVTPGTEVKLSWKPGANAKSHKLYFATQADELSLVDEVTEPAYAKLPRPQRDKTYYWRVDEVQADGSVIEGDVWSFNTGKLVARWKFDETSGTTVADSAGSGYDGTAVHGKPVWDPDGKHGGCLDFDETYGFSIPKEVFSSIDKALTISVWVKGNEKQRRHSDVILQAGAGDDGKPYIVSIYTDWLEYGLKFATGFRQPDRLEFNPGAPEDWTGRWNHYAFVKDADRGFQRIYLNGSLVAEKTDATAPMSGVGAARIGIAPDRFGDQHIGKLDDLRIYNYALSEQEIGALCPAPKASRPKPANKAVIGPTGQLELSWRPGTNAVRHKVYVGASPDELSLLAETTDPSYQGPTDMEPGATYYWRVDEVQADGSIVTGDLWSFSIRGLIGWWRLDGDTKDSSGNNHHGTIKGDPKWVTGRIEAALEFDGVDDYVDTGDARRLPVWTVAVWVKSPAAPSSAMQSGPAHWEPNFHLNWDHQDPFFRGTASLQAQGRWYAASFGPLEGNTWYHLCATYDGEDLKAYKDGVLITNESGPSGEPTAGTATLKFGRHTLVEQHFAGTVDDVRVYNYALSDEEIQRLCQEVLSPDGAQETLAKERPMFESQVYDNSALDLETGALAPLDKGAVAEVSAGGNIIAAAGGRPEWPEGFDLAWDNDGGGTLMVGPGSGARIVALPAAKKDEWDQVIPMARRTLEVLGTSTAKGVLASQSRFVAVLTCEGNLAVVEIGEHDADKATLYWWVETSRK
ncbi:MAG: LamG domain-containing protein, partial [Planctomycetota bacterium]